ncbi:DDE superfamily endonuclease [Gracilaria domingensis]|nr:DDE superfamily endonuclease [Gracilaria domingensis]
MDLVNRWSVQHELFAEADKILELQSRHQNAYYIQRFCSIFGVEPIHVLALWKELLPIIIHSCKEKHLLWALLLLKLYNTEHKNAILCGVDEKTFRKWSLYVVQRIASIQRIVFYNRLNPHPFLNRFMSIDGVDVRIKEPKPFSKEWFSYKFPAAGLRYEIGIALATDEIVWINGPFSCGTNTDQSILTSKLNNMLLENEFVLTDTGYQSSACLTPDNVPDSVTEIHCRYRARHEKLHSRMKQFSCLQHRFRHDKSLHVEFMFDVCNVNNVFLKMEKQHFPENISYQLKRRSCYYLQKRKFPELDWVHFNICVVYIIMLTMKFSYRSKSYSNSCSAKTEQSSILCHNNICDCLRRRLNCAP